MLMKNPEHKVPATGSECERGQANQRPFVEHASHVMLIGQIALILVFALAILLRSMS
nr:hypothetical protein [Rhodopirellula sp. SM50]